MRYTSLFPLAVMSVIVISLAGSACESVCGDSEPEDGESCSGTATCGQTCGTTWKCKGGKWSVSMIADCFSSGYDEPVDAGKDGEAGTGVDADADAACDAQGDHDAAVIPAIPPR